MSFIFNHLPITDLAYSINFKNLIKDLDENFINNENEKTILYKKISLCLFYKDYDSFNDDGKKLVDQRKDKLENIRKEIHEYFSNISVEQLISDLSFNSKTITINNKFEYFKTAYSINESVTSDKKTIAKLFSESKYPLPLYFLLEFKMVVYNNKQFFHNFLLENPITIEHFVRYYDLYNPHKTKLYFPEFTNDEINKWILDYTKCDYPNPNYINAALLHNKNDIYELSAKTIIELRKFMKEFAEKHASGPKISCDISCSVVPNQNETIRSYRENNVEYINLSGKWISDNKDYPTLLNNLIYLVEMCDENMRLDTYNSNNNGAIYNSLYSHNENEYGSNLFFIRQNRQLLIFRTYVCYLKKRLNINIEDVYKWFFEQYLKNEFNIHGMNIHLLPQVEDYYLKCCAIFAQTERALREFAVYVENGKYSAELFDATKKKYKIFEYPSLFPDDKYFEINEKSDINLILALLFSDQSWINFTKDNIYEESFVNLIVKHNIKKSDYTNEISLERITQLIKNNIIFINKDGFLKLVSPYECVVLRQLYEIGFINFRNLSSNENKALNKIIGNKWVYNYGRFFSKEEASLFSFYFNNEQHVNNLMLRNLYEHGSFADTSSKKHEDNYYIGLWLLGIVVIKINDELCQKFGWSNKNEL